MTCMLEHLAVPELSSAPPLLMSRMKMVQLSKWQLVPPTLRDRGTVILHLSSVSPSSVFFAGFLTNSSFFGYQLIDWRLRVFVAGNTAKLHPAPDWIPEITSSWTEITSSWTPKLVNNPVSLDTLTLDKNNIIYITIYVSKQITNLSQNKKIYI